MSTTNKSKLYFRGTSRPEVFPIGRSCSKDSRIIKEINTGHDGNTVYSSKGLAVTQKAPGGGQGGKGGIYKIKEATKKGYAEAGEGDSINFAVPNSKTRRGRVGNGVANTLDTACQQGTLEDMKIRRLTPKECERLQGFPDVEKYVKIKVCKQQNANGVELNFNTKNIDQENAVQNSVLIDCVENGVEIHSQGKLLLNAKNAEKENWSHQHIKIDDFVLMLVGINLILEKIMQDGEVDYLLNEQCLIHLKNGKKLEKLFGKEMMQPVGNVEKDLITLKELLKSITLDHLDTENLEQKLAILSSFVIRAIIGYIPNEIKNQNTFTIIVKSKVGWTYGCSDTQRYKMCGNAVTVNVIKEIMTKVIHS